MPRGQLWETALRDGTPVWLLEWEVSQRLTRRLLLAVDTSDSCAAESQQLRSFFQVLTNALDPGDSCAMWLVGSSQKVFDEVLRHSQQRPEVVQKMAQAITTVRGGTWFERTLEGMLSEAFQTPPDVQCYYLIVSDGEIFDIEGLLHRMPASLGLIRMGQRKSRQIDTLIQHTIEVGSNEPALKRFLLATPVSVVLEPRGDGSRTVEFSAHSRILRELTERDPLSLSVAHTMARVAYVGGKQPQPRLRYLAPDRNWEVIDLQCSSLLAGQRPHLDMVVRALEGNQAKWDFERLKLLANDREKKLKLRCPLDGRERSVRESLFCLCGALLVSLDGIKKSDVQSLYQGTIYFPFEGGIPRESPHACSDSTGDHAYAFEDGEQPRLVLNLFK